MDTSILGEAIVPATGNESFSADDLSAEQRVWHDRLWAAINDTPYPDALALAASGDLYQIARPVSLHVAAVMAAFRATGDYALLDWCDTVMEAARAALADADGDGYREWVYKAAPMPEEYWGTDEGMDKNMADALVASHAYALSLNLAHSQAYRDHYAAWMDYLQNDAIPDGQSNKTLMHTHMEHLRWDYYTYRLGLQDAAACVNYANIAARAMVARQTADGTAYVWDHRVLERYDASEGCQATEYASYTVSCMMELALEGITLFDDAFMRCIAATARALVLAGGLGAIAPDVCGGVTVEEEPFDSIVTSAFTSGKYTASAWPGLARWDDTGYIASLAEAAHRVNVNGVFVPAYMLLALT